MAESHFTGRAEPYISASALAELTVSSERKKRSIVARQKWRSPPALIPYQEPSAILSSFLGTINKNFSSLQERIALMERTAHDSEWRTQVNNLNIGMMKAFVLNYNKFKFPDASIKLVGSSSPRLNYGGTDVGVSPHLLILRITKAGSHKVGVARFEYSKGKVYSAKEAEWLTAVLFDFARQHRNEDGSAERKLCICIDVGSGKIHHAPGDAIAKVNEMKAVCQSIAERWASIPAPSTGDDDF